MIDILKKFNNILTLKTILLAFWMPFWLLNGLDKFFNQPTFFGVTRDEKFIGYFARLALPADMALISLYSFAVIEVLLGLSFLYVLLRRESFAELERLNFKLGMCLFVIFICGDILFGDRMELWEHSTFMVLMVISLSLLSYVEHEGPDAIFGYPMALQTNFIPYFVEPRWKEVFLEDSIETFTEHQ